KIQMSSIFGSPPADEWPTSIKSEAQAEKSVFTMLLFDIDGVITEPVTGEVALEVVDEIVEILERGEPVAFNTGRGLSWVLRDIVPYFEQRISARTVLNRLCIVYEKG